MTDEAAYRECELMVIIPVHDRAEALATAVSSVLAQSRSGVRVLVVDDGSAEPVDAVLPLDDRVAVLRIEHAGVARARNAGVAAAGRACWVAFLDSDDVVLDGWVDAFSSAFADDAVLVSCAARYEWDDGSSETVEPAPIWHEPAAPRALFLAGTFAVRRALFEEAGGYRAGLSHGENTDLGWRIGSQIRRSGGRVVVVDRPLMQVNARRAQRDPLVLLDSANMVLADPPELLLADRATHASYYAIAGVAASRLGRRREALGLLSHAVRLQPGEPRHVARIARALVRRDRR